MKRGATWKKLLKAAQLALGTGAPGIERLDFIVQTVLGLAIAAAATTGRPVVVPGFASLRTRMSKKRRTLGRDGKWYEVAPRHRLALRPTQAAHVRVAKAKGEHR